jgi:hypothetical protein
MLSLNWSMLPISFPPVMFFTAGFGLFGTGELTADKTERGKTQWTQQHVTCWFMASALWPGGARPLFLA